VARSLASRGIDRAELGAQLALAVPLAAQQVGLQLMGAVDTAFIGRYSPAALAGVGVANALVFTISAIGMGVVMGLDTVAPQALGAGRVDDARRSLGAGLRLAVLVGLPATLLVLAAPLLLPLAGVSPAVADEARVYLYARALGVVPFLATIALRSYLAAHGTTRPLIIAVVVGNVVNALGDWILIYGDAGLADLHLPRIGLPALGVLGAAIPTSAVQLMTLGVYVLAVRGLDRAAPRPPSTAADLATIARYGLPIGGQLLAEIGVFALAGILAAHLGEIPAAAHSVAINVASFSFSVAVGIGSATSVRVGHAVGQGDLALARRRGTLGLILGVAVMSGFALCLVAFAAPLARVFTDDAAVLLAAVPLLHVAALFQLSDGAQAIGAGALRGLGNTRATLVGNLLGHYGVGVAVSLVLAFPLALGVTGLWWGLSAGLSATAIYLVVRFRRDTRPSGSS
jgi:MATE family multidrug resistance protein